MDGRREEALPWLARAADRYRESYPLAPQGSWGRPIGALKADPSRRPVRGRIGRALGAGRRGCSVGVADRPLRGLPRAARARARRRAAARAHARRPRRLSQGIVAEALRALASGDAQAYDGAVRSVLAPSRPARIISRTFRSPTPPSCCKRSQRRAGSRSSSSPTSCRRLGLRGRGQAATREGAGSGTSPRANADRR